ncbi:unnamed protein product [Cuscuta epithymum]|uniref:RRM domain-containing protein n=1 Tax=Cuscuta epithymum TaxID=186058 RepID=A0AAV0FHR8_9ASTE|nr:unnamed protein product [Cuscuta epithymum]
MLGSGGVRDGYDIGSKRPRMTESNPYFAVNISQNGYPFGHGYPSASAFPVVRLRGLPFDCSESDIRLFFAGLDIIDAFMVNKNGRFSGEAFVLFAGNMHAENALLRDRQNIGRRYVEVFRCKKQDYYQAIAAEMRELQGFEHDHHHHSSPPPQAHRPPKRTQNKDHLEYTETLKLRGLPFSVNKSDIIKFFGGDYNLTDEKVCIGYRSDGKATGEAYVEFSSPEEAKSAMCKDNMMIGSRYIELFPSTQDEAKRADYRPRK